MAQAEAFFMMGVEIGLATPRAMAIGKVAGKDMELKLAQPAVFGTIQQILDKYGVDTSTVPAYFHKALTLQATIQMLEYSSRVYGDIGANNQITWYDDKLAKAKIEKPAGTITVGRKTENNKDVPVLKVGD